MFNAFCGSLAVRKVPAGFAVGTGYDTAAGDPLGFFIIGPDVNGKFRIEDDGLSVPFIEAMGVDLSSKSRTEAFNALMGEYDVLFDDDSGELTTSPLGENEVAGAALRFVAFLLRIQDLKK